MKWVVYILRCADGSLYTGMTNDLSRRLERHAAGKAAAYTRSRLPVKLVFEQGARNLSSALRKEAALKRLSRKEKLTLVAQRASALPAGGGTARSAIHARTSRRSTGIGTAPLASSASWKARRSKRSPSA